MGQNNPPFLFHQGMIVFPLPCRLVPFGNVNLEKELSFVEEIMVKSIILSLKGEMCRDPILCYILLSWHMPR